MVHIKMDFIEYNIMDLDNHVYSSNNEYSYRKSNHKNPTKWKFMWISTYRGRGLGIDILDCFCHFFLENLLFFVKEYQWRVTYDWFMLSYTNTALQSVYVSHNSRTKYRGDCAEQLCNHLHLLTTWSWKENEKKSWDT